MTVREAIDFVDEIKPNSFSDSVKLKWINQVESRVALELYLASPEETEEHCQYELEALDTDLLVKAPYDDIYTWWLQAQIDLANGEYDRASNTTALFNASWRAFARWFLSAYDPDQNGAVPLEADG